MVVLITGVTGGLGEILGPMAAQAGMRVYGTTRNPDANQERFAFPLLALDVTSDASVQACVDALLEKEQRIDVLINCANEMFIGGVHETTAEEVKHLYDTNVFGVMRMCKAVSKVMRAQGEGTIVNMSSLGGVLAVPYMSSYTSAKFAMEAFSEALYHELRFDGVSVVIMQPVAMRMDRPDTGHHLRLVDNVQEDSISHKMLRRMAADTAASKLTPQSVAQKIIEVIQAPKKPLRVPMDRAKGLSVVKRLAPQGVIDKMITGLVGLGPART